MWQRSISCSQVGRPRPPKTRIVAGASSPNAAMLRTARSTLTSPSGPTTIGPVGPHAVPGGQSGQDRQPLPGPLVHPGLALQTVCPVRDVLMDYLAERQAAMDFPPWSTTPTCSASCSGPTSRPTTRPSARSSIGQLADAAIGQGLGDRREDRRTARGTGPTGSRPCRHGCGDERVVSAVAVRRLVIRGAGSPPRRAGRGRSCGAWRTRA
jgi:hypothetical protein